MSVDGLPAGYDAWRTTPPDCGDPNPEAVERAERCESIRGRIREKLKPAVDAGLIDDLRELEREGGSGPRFEVEDPDGTKRRMWACVEDIGLEDLAAFVKFDAECEAEDLSTFEEDYR